MYGFIRLTFWKLKVLGKSHLITSWKPTLEVRWPLTRRLFSWLFNAMYSPAVFWMFYQASKHVSKASWSQRWKLLPQSHGAKERKKPNVQDSLFFSQQGLFLPLWCCWLCLPLLFLELLAAFPGFGESSWTDLSLKMGLFTLSPTPLLGVGG